MRRLLLLAGLFALAGLCPGEEAGAGADVPLLPLSIPGYRLRVLDVRKPVVFEVAGTKVEASVPVFFYFPETGPGAAELIRRARDGLADLERKPEWTAAELQRIVAGLDQGLALLEAKAPGG